MLARVRRVCTSLATALLLAGGAATAGAHATPTASSIDDATGPGTYLVVLTDPPAASYAGDDPLFAATRPRAGERFDRTRPAVAAYAAHLRDHQDRVLDALGDVTVLYRFTTALNGFAADLTGRQVKALRAMDDVSLVERSTVHRLDTVESPDFLGLDEAWAATGGPDGAGRGMVVGVVDSGLWPENPSFTGLPLKHKGRVPGLDGFRGGCAAGDQWVERNCTDKVVSARYFVKGFGATNLAASEYLSPRDGTGHGTHTAAIAAGNDGVRAHVDGQSFGAVSGMAPSARIAVYKACWTAPEPDDDGCSTADAVAAVDRAVADGVDVLNYSISGAGSSPTGTVARAFLHASAAGVFVATSAGNDGPAAGSVAHASPWVTTVGASTHNSFQGAVVVGDGSQYVGAMVADADVPRAALVLAEDAAATGAAPAEARRCEDGALAADKVLGKIVVCDRGTIARVEKSAAVARAGGAAMVLANVTPDSVDADFHSVPTVHVDVAAAEAVRRYVRDAERPTASFEHTASDATPVPQVAGFSSRGPVTAAGGDLLKPDLTAPGVSVLAAVAPASNFGRMWDLYSGTSMSAAHVAGIAAFVRGERPAWSPAAVKSALATTAVDLEGVSGPAAEGSGQVDAASVLDPGVVFDVTPEEYFAFLHGRRPASTLNVPSIALGDLTGTARVVRRVTNVSGSVETFSARTTGLDGVDVTVRPQVLQLGPGETGRFAVRFRSRAGAPLGEATRGHIVWTGLRHQARMPVVVRPSAVAAPAEVSGSGGDGTLSLEGVAGTDGTLGLSVAGLARTVPIGLTLEPGLFDPTDPTADIDTARIPTTVPAGTEVVRFDLAGRDTDDIDLYLFRDGGLVASSTSRSADETLTLVEPEPGDYALHVHSVSAANGSTTTAQLYTWLVRPGDAGTVALPQQVEVTAGERFAVELSWTGLDPTARWFGAVRYAGSDERTFVTVN